MSWVTTGSGVIEYTEQLTCLPFFKMTQEPATRRLVPAKIGPGTYSWQRSLDAQGTEVAFVYTQVLVGLSREPGVVGTIFDKAQNRIQDPAKPRRLVHDLIEKESWSQAGTGIIGDAYEELLSREASDGGSGAGQYCTPRPPIRATVRDTVVDPNVRDSLTADPGPAGASSSPARRSAASPR